MKCIRLTLLGGVLACALNHVTIAQQPADQLSPADQKLIDNARRQWYGLIDAQEKWDQQNIKQSIQDMAESDALYEKIRLLFESQVHKGESELQKQSDANLEIIRLYEKSPPDDLGHYGIFREAMLRQGMVCVDLAEPENALKWARKASTIHDFVQRRSSSPPVLKLRDNMATCLRLSLICLGSKRPLEAARFLDAVNAASELLRQHPLIGDVYLLRSKIANSEQAHSRARDAAQQALDVFLKQFPQGHAQIAEAQCQLATAQVGLSDFSKARKLLIDADMVLKHRAVQRKNDSKQLRADINRLLAQVHLEEEQEGNALSRADKARELYQELFANFRTSHPDFIRALSSLAEMLNRYQHPNADEYARTAWSECQKRFVRGPHDLRVVTRDLLGQCLRDAGQLTEAKQQFDAALAEALHLYPETEYPHGHDRLALCQWHTSGLLGQLGQYGQALAMLRAVEASYRARYPKGHPQLAVAAADVGVINLKAGNAQASYDAFASALSEDQRQLKELEKTSVETSAAKSSELRQTALSGYLSATRGNPVLDERAFQWTWDSKNVQTRRARARRAQIRQSQEVPGVRPIVEQLNDLGTRRRQLLSHPEDEVALQYAMDESRRLELELQKLVPAGETSRGGFAEFARSLPRDAVFIKILLYDDLTAVSDRSTDAKASPQNYVAFVLVPGQKVRRIELGSAALIDESVKKWRSEESVWGMKNQAPKDLRAANGRAKEILVTIREKVWLPISKLMPAGTTTLLLDLDGRLAQFPFAAIPKDESKGILLEDYAIAYLPDGQFMQEDRQLGAGEFPQEFKVLTVGFVDYGDLPEPKYTPLPLTESEVQAVIQSSGAAKTIALTGRNATVAGVQKYLSTVDAAFIATHASFDSEELEKDKAETRKTIEKWRGEASPVIPYFGLSERFPFSYVGLVLAGANNPPPGNPDRGILQGEGILNLDLDNLRLVVLSCCETALGQQRPLEAVPGMQQAFHYAGCRNVVATLWTVDDNASSQLMQEFIRQLETGKLTSLEALRQAQLKIYHNSELLGPRYQPYPKSPVYAWGAFIHSGVGTPLPMSKKSQPTGVYAWIGICCLGIGMLVYATSLLRPRAVIAA